MDTRKAGTYRRKPPTEITKTTPAPPTRKQVGNYPDIRQWEIAIDKELDKIDKMGTIWWLKPGTRPTTKPIPMKLSLNYKRDQKGKLEERKARGSLRGDLMQPVVHFDPEWTSAPVVDRVATRMVISHEDKHGWIVEHMDIYRAFLNEKFKYFKPIFIKEPPRKIGKFKHGGTVGILELNFYGNTSGTYYHLNGLLGYMHKEGFESKEHEICLVRLRTRHRTVIVAIAVDEFLPASSHNEQWMSSSHFSVPDTRSKGLGDRPGISGGAFIIGPTEQYACHRNDSSPRHWQMRVWKQLTQDIRSTRRKRNTMCPAKTARTCSTRRKGSSIWSVTYDTWKTAKGQT